MNSLRSLMAFTMMGKPNFANRKNTTPKESTIQKMSPGSGVSGFMDLLFCSGFSGNSGLSFYCSTTRRHTTMANKDTPSMKAAVRIMDVRMLPAADG